MSQLNVAEMDVQQTHPTNLIFLNGVNIVFRGWYSNKWILYRKIENNHNEVERARIIDIDVPEDEKQILLILGNEEKMFFTEPLHEIQIAWKDDDDDDGKEIITDEKAQKLIETHDPILFDHV